MCVVVTHKNYATIHKIVCLDARSVVKVVCLLIRYKCFREGNTHMYMHTRTKTVAIIAKSKGKKKKK